MTVMSPRSDLVPVESFPVDPLPQTGKASDDLLDLRQLWNILRSHRRIFGAAVAVSLLLATAYLLLVPPTYTATSILLIDPRQERVLTSEAVLSGIGADADADAQACGANRTGRAAARRISRFMG